MAKFLIGTDIGTTGTKSILFSEEGKILGHAYEGYPTATPAPGRCEQNPEDWWKALCHTIKRVVACAGAENDVAAISLSLQGGTMVPVDKNYNATHAAFVWSDKRCEKQISDFISLYGEDYMYKTTGWRNSAGLNAMTIKWLKENAPAAFKNTAMFLSVPDYISYRLTGRTALDISDAGINQLADIKAFAYDNNILNFCGIHENMLGEIVDSGEPIGYLTKDALDALGLKGDVLLVAGAHDQYAGLLGAGVCDSGDVLIGTGTAWVVTALTACPNFESGFSQSVSASGMWGSLVSLSTGGVSLEWLKGKIALGEADDVSIGYDALNIGAEKAGIGAGGLKFYPYFNGAGFPVKNPNAKATFVGLDLSHDRYSMARAIMEGVAMHTIWTLEAFDKAYGIRHLKVSGGATKSPLWTSIIADLANHPVYVPGNPDMPCVGAAVLAGKGCGLFKTVAEGSKILSVEERIIYPNEDRVKAYVPLLEKYKDGAKGLSAIY